MRTWAPLDRVPHVSTSHRDVDTPLLIRGKYKCFTPKGSAFGYRRLYKGGRNFYVLLFIITSPNCAGKERTPSLDWVILYSWS